MLRLLQLVLPALVPSWRFFKAVAPSPRVELRIEKPSGWSDWAEARPRPTQVTPVTMAKRLFWNPAWNEALFLVSLSERAIVEDDPFPAAEIAARVGARLGAVRFQYRLVFVERQGGTLARAVAYESPVHLGTA